MQRLNLISDQPSHSFTNTTTTIASNNLNDLVNGGDDDNDDIDFLGVHILNSIFDYHKHSLPTHILLSPSSAFVKQPFVPPLVSISKSFDIYNNPSKAEQRPQRLLTNAPTLDGLNNEMSAIADEAPGSPPGLTASKSSKSSTNRSSSSAGTDGILTDVTHFEDIGLEEEETHSLQQRKQHNGPGPRGFATRRSVTAYTHTNTVSHKHNNTPSMAPMRDLTNQGARSPNLPMAGFTNMPVSPHSLNIPSGFPRRKFPRNASTPSLAIKAMSNYNRSRSPSPQNTPPMLSNPFPNAGPHRRPSSSSASHSPAMPIRRGSWQPNRKSVKELEAECDEEDEDDLPDEASLWNVPLSPRPPCERNINLSPVPSPRLSPGGSPERSSPLRTSIGADGVQFTAPKPIPLPTTRRTLPANFQSPPVSPHKLTRGVSTGQISDIPPNQRSKSWTAALSELSEDAKALTRSLENHAISKEMYHESAVQNGEVTSLEKLSRSKTAPIAQLPPLRTNNIMIDPLPISKEKERVLSRTRPSWLPPKSKSEEKRHLKEYQRMMELSREAERKKAAQSIDSKCAKDDTKSTLSRLWEEHVLPNWDQLIRDPRTRELWWRGVGPKSRAKVWTKAIGNDLALTPTTYSKAFARAQKISADLATAPSSSSFPFPTTHSNSTTHTHTLHPKQKIWHDSIARDVRATFPSLKLFQPGAPLHAPLTDVLIAYSTYRSDVGYSHGTHLIAAFLLLTLPTPAEAFICLANLLNRPLPLAFLTGDPAGEAKAYKLVIKLLGRKFPRLCEHLFGSQQDQQTGGESGGNDDGAATSNVDGSTASRSRSLNLHPADILEPMLRTLFLGPGSGCCGIGLDVAARVWDVIVFDGDAAVIRTAVAVLGRLEARLYGSREEVLGVLGWRGGEGWAEVMGDEDAFMEAVRAVGRGP